MGAEGLTIISGGGLLPKVAAYEGPTESVGPLVGGMESPSPRGGTCWALESVVGQVTKSTKSAVLCMYVSPSVMAQSHKD